VLDHQQIDARPHVDFPERPVILIVGGAGAMGSSVARRLLAQGARVRVMTRAPEWARELERGGAEIVTGNLLDRASLARTCRGVEQVVTAAHSMLGRGREASAYVDGRVSGA
jgi:dihydroflavonol-4-reductase